VHPTTNTCARVRPIGPRPRRLVPWLALLAMSAAATAAPLWVGPGGDYATIQARTH
jgi:hypothetical protein